MKTRIIILGAATAVVAASLGQITANARPRPDEGGVAAGPDVIVGSLHSNFKWGSIAQDGKTIMAYSFGTISCNIGTAQLLWQQWNSNHPVIPQNAYRIKNGRIEQIGMSWLKHGFCALQQSLCGPCQPAGAGCPSVLGIGCSDPYDATLNGEQNNLGPRSQVNAFSGVFPYPFTAPAAPATIGRRVQIDKDDCDPALNAGAIYVAEGMYVHPQDAASGNGENNASHRSFTVGSFTSGAYNLTMTGGTTQTKPAIFAWQTAHPDVVLEKVSVPGDGVFYVGSRVVDNGNGTWHYEYAIFNLNSDRCASSLNLPIPAGAAVSNIGFKDISYHSGEPYDGTDWSVSSSGGSGGELSWACTQTWVENSNANALRWATLYNFWFDADSAPESAVGTIGLFKPGASSDVAFTAKVPMGPVWPLGDLNQDGVVNGADLGLLLAAWGTDAADLNNDGTTDGADLGILLANWTP